MIIDRRRFEKTERAREREREKQRAEREKKKKNVYNFGMKESMQPRRSFSRLFQRLAGQFAVAE